MPHLNVYLSKERENWLRECLDLQARAENRSVSYIVEEALVAYLQKLGRKPPSQQRIDRRTRRS